MSIFRKVAVIGAGKAGRDFALRCVRSGCTVVLEDVLPSKLRLASDLLAEQQIAPGEQLQFANTVEDAVRDADIAIDFVPDELESKLEIVSMIDRMAPPRTVLCVPTVTLSITDLASCTYRPEQCLALTGVLASDTIKLVRGRLSGTRAVADTSEWLHRLGYAVTVADETEQSMLVKNVQGHT